MAKCKECGHYRFHLKNCKTAMKDVNSMSKCQWCSSREHRTEHCPMRPVQ